MSPDEIALTVAFVALVVNGLVGLGVEGSKRTTIAGVFAAGWLTLIEGLGFLALWWSVSFPHGLALGIGFLVLGLGIVGLPIAHREFQRGSSDH